MENYNIKVNLAKIKGAVAYKDPSSKKKYLMLPLDNPCFFQGKSGVYLNIAAWQFKDGGANSYNESHYLRESLPKSEYEKLSQEEKKAMPIIGSMSVMEFATKQFNGAINMDDCEDLPF